MIALARGLRNGIDRLRRGCFGLLFPSRCVYCDVELLDHCAKSSLCANCLATCAPEEWRGCPRCGAPVAAEENCFDVCASCRNKKLRFDSVVVLGGYHSGLREAVLQMKRPAHNPLSTALGRLMFERRREQLSEVQADMIIPIPMHWRRRLRRGKNNPDTLADCLAKSLGIPARRDVLVRHVNTKPQAGLCPASRLLNVRGAFRVRRPADVRNARILLVDDVLTTGATCSEAAKTLKQAGAAMVAAAVVARADRAG